VANEDLSKLKIDRGGSTGVTKRKRRKRPMVTLIAAAALALFFVSIFQKYHSY
jgi:hypothetical protein